MRYEDFVIQIGPKRGSGHVVQVLKSPAGEGAGVFQPPFDLARWEAIRENLQRGHDRARSQVPGSAPESRDFGTGQQQERSPGVQEVGGELFRSLFAGQIRTLWDQSLGTIRSRPGWGLRVKLKLDPADGELASLASLPWEFLWQSETEDFLSLSRHSPFVRYLDVPRPVAPIRVRSHLRVLVVTSNPRDLPSLDLEQERRNLETASRRWQGVEVEFLERAEPGALRQALLSAPFHVLYFMGHGGFNSWTGDGVLYFEGPDRQSEPVSGRALATILKDFKSLGLVFLNACNTARAHASGLNPFSGVSNALVLGGVPAVVAMQFPISDEAAIAFGTAFYQRLALGDPLDAAVVEGRQAVHTVSTQTPEWGTPVLFLRVPDANVFLVSGRRQEPDDPEDDGKASRLRRRAVAGALLALALGVAVPAVWTWRDAAGTSAPGVYRIDLGRSFESTVQGISGTLTRIEITAAGRMRMYFRFRNASRGDVGLGFDYHRTYLADEAGNRYAVLAADGGGADGDTAMDQVRRGEEVERWIEFPAPSDRARSFHVGLVGPEGAPGFPLFEIDLPNYPEKLSLSSSLPPPAAGSMALKVGKSFAADVEGLRNELKHVELLANGRMRWHFGFLNGSDRDQAISFNYSLIYLQDELGNRYGVLGSDTGGGVGQYFREILQRAVRADHWIEFPSPVLGARKFTVVLASQDGTVRFLPFTTQVPYYPARYSRTVPARPVKPAPAAASAPPPPQEVVIPAVEPEPVPVDLPRPRAESQPEPQSSPVSHTARGEWETSIPGLSGKLEAIAALEDGRMRWTFSFVNRSGRPLEIGFDFEKTYLSDNPGNRYSVVRTDTGPPDHVHREILPDGGRTTHWAEFPAPTAGARKFTAVLSSHAPDDLRFVPLQVEIPQWTKPQ